MKEKIDINKQYEEIFGREQRPNIFAPDDEGYASLRQEILDAEREYNSEGVLPFNGLIVPFYEDNDVSGTGGNTELWSSYYVVNENTDSCINIANVVDNLLSNADLVEMLKGIENSQKQKEEGSSHQLFFIKRISSEREKFCNAFGYYDESTKKFVLQAGSILATGSGSLLTTMSRCVFLQKHCTKVSQGYRLEQDCVFDAPSTAAGYVLGRSANGWKEWKDCNGNTLDFVYRKCI